MIRRRKSFVLALSDSKKNLPLLPSPVLLPTFEAAEEPRRRRTTNESTAEEAVLVPGMDPSEGWRCALVAGGGG